MGVEAGEFRGTDRYSIVRRLGQGGMGVVYEALDRKDNRRVALKTVRFGEASTIYRLKREFRALADLSHPNLVALHELVSDADRVFFTMDLVPGVDFVRWARGESRTCSDDVIARLRIGLPQLVAGVRALHDAAKIHRDLKPSNVQVTADDRVVVLDFGLVADLDLGHARETSDAQVSGTAEYMSPEQAASEQLSVASDWYGVGSILYEALTGQPPFSGPRLQILMRKQKDEPPEPRTFDAAIPAALNDLCMALLAREPSRRPGGDQIAAWAESNRAVSLPPLTIHATQLPRFVGRARERAILRHAYDLVREGHTVTVHVAGSSGFGKSALVREFTTGLIESDGARVIRGRCHERESVPFKAIDSMVDALTRELMRLPRTQSAAMLPRDVHALARIFPVLRRVEAVADVPRRTHETPDPQELRRRAFSALREILARMSDALPLVVWIDDLQWGDGDSAMLLAELVRPPDPPGLLLIVSYRSEGATETPALAQLFAARRAMSSTARHFDIDVEPFGDRESIELAEILLGGPSAVTRTFAESIARDAAGSPFLIEELSRLVTMGEGVDRTASGRVRLDTIVAHRLDAMPQPARALALVLAVAGQPIGRALALRGAGLNGADEAIAIPVLRAAYWVRSHHAFDGEELDFYQARIREAVLKACRAEELAAIHAALARIHESTPRPDPEALTLHLRGARDFERAGLWAEAAATRASEALAFDRATTWYRTAMELRPLTGDLARQRLRKLGDALINAGRGTEAAAVYLQIATEAHGAEMLECRVLAADQLLRSGHVDDGVQVVREALAQVGIRYPETTWWLIVRVIVYRLWLSLRGYRSVRRRESELTADVATRVGVCFACASGLAVVSSLRAVYFSQRGAMLALRVGDRQQIARSLAHLAATLAIDGPRAAPRIDAAFAAAEEAAQGVEHPYPREFITFMRGVACFLQGQWTESLERCDLSDVNLRDRCTGVAWERASTQIFALWSLFYSGRLKELGARIPKLLAEASDRGDLYLLTNLRIGRMAVPWLLRDDPDRALQEVDEAMHGWSRAGVHQQHYYACSGRVQALLYKGDAARALQLLDESWNLFGRALIFRIQTCRIEALHLRGCIELAVGSEPARLRRVQRIAKRICREQAPWARALGELLHAGVAHAERRTDDELGHLRDAERAAVDTDMALFAAAARYRMGGEPRSSAEAYFAEQGVARPEALLSFVSPGYRR